MGRLVLDIRGQTLDLLHNLGFCGILATLDDPHAIEVIEGIIRSLSGPDLAVYLNSGNTRNLPPASSTRDSTGPHSTDGTRSPPPPTHHASPSPFNVRNPTLRDLSTLATRISRALMEGRPPVLRTPPSSEPSPTATPIPAPITRSPRRRPRARLLACFTCGSRNHFKLDCPHYVCSGCGTAAPGHNLSACPNRLDLPDETDHSSDGTL